MDLDLLGAAKQGQHQQVQELLAAGAHVEAVDVNGMTALHAAAGAGHQQVVQQLLAAGADVNTADAYGDSCLYYAACRGDYDMVKLLLNSGATTSNTQGGAVLFEAVRRAHAPMVQLLLAAGADVEAFDLDGHTPLQTATLYDCYEVAQLLLRNGADPQQHHYGCCVLHTAAVRGRKRILKLFLESWGKPRITDAQLTAAANLAAGNLRLPGCRATFALLAKELWRLYPAAFQRFIGGGIASRIRASKLLAAVLDARASDVSDLDEQRAALHKREEAVASEQQRVQQLIVAVADMAHVCAQPEPEPLPQQDPADTTNSDSI